MIAEAVRDIYGEVSAENMAAFRRLLSSVAAGNAGRMPEEGVAKDGQMPGAPAQQAPYRQG